jgi:hypothetical protein
MQCAQSLNNIRVRKELYELIGVKLAKESEFFGRSGFHSRMIPESGRTKRTILCASNPAENPF